MIKLTSSYAADKDIYDIAPSFDTYRQFYEQPYNVRLAHSYLSERLANKGCIIFVARRADGTALRLVQLHPSFCSIAVFSLSKHMVHQVSALEPNQTKLVSYLEEHLCLITTADGLQSP